MKCPNCNTENRLHLRWCWRCGIDLVTEPAPSSGGWLALPPLWKRVWICLRHLRAWRMRRKIDAAASVLRNQGVDYDLGHELATLSRRLWQEAWATGDNAADRKSQNDAGHLWIVGKELDYTKSAWEFQGVFDAESDAIAACKTERYFIGPALVNKAVPDRRAEWNGAYYPKAPNV